MLNFGFHRSGRLRLLYAGICLLSLLQTAFGQSTYGLTVQVIEGSRAKNIVSEAVTKPLVVRALDRTGRPIAGASIQFVAPDVGAGGNFVTQNPVIVSTDREGFAAAPEFRANSLPGPYQIQIIATHRGEVTRLLVPQSNVGTVAEMKKSSKKMFIISAVVGGAAAAAFAAKGRGGSPAPPQGATTTPSITFQDLAVGAPR